MYNHITTLQQEDETYAAVSIDFENRFGEIEVHKITDVETGEAIDIAIDDYTYREMAEMAADLEAEHRSNGRYGSDVFESLANILRP